jgi:hypothetical protein
MAILGALVCSTIGCKVLHKLHLEGDGIQGSGKAKTESRTVGSFSKIAVEGPADVKWTQSDKQTLSVKTDDNLLSNLETEIKGDTLYIRFKENCSTKTDSIVTIASPTLDGLAISGSSDAELLGISSDDFNISVSGSGDVTASGTAKSADISISGSGDVDAFGLQLDSADVSIAGSGEMKLSVKTLLDASIAGSGDISYRGDPKVQKSVMGSGDVSRVN